MNNIPFRYLILPKGIKSIFFKSYVYFIPFLYVLNSSSNYFYSLILFLSIFFLFEFVINPARYQFNDSIDYEGDQKRKFNWVRPVTRENKGIVLFVCFSRFILGTILAFLIDFRLGILAVILFFLQLIYDFFAKKNSAFLAIFVVSIAYPIRSLVVFFGLNIKLTHTVYLILLSIFMYSTYMIIQWRKNESVFILSNNLEKKYNSSVFVKNSVDSILNIILMVFLFSFYFLIVDLLKVQGNYQILIVGIMSFVIIMLFIFNIKTITTQSHNILILFIFLLLLNNKILSSVSIIIIVAFSIIWYHKVYVIEFTKIYFKEKNEQK